MKTSSSPFLGVTPPRSDRHLFSQTLAVQGVRVYKHAACRAPKPRGLVVRPSGKKRGPGAFCPRALVWRLAIPYFHTANCRTIIGARRFHFRVRDGSGWVTPAMVTKQFGVRPAAKGRGAALCRGAPPSLAHPSRAAPAGAARSGGPGNAGLPPPPPTRLPWKPVRIFSRACAGPCQGPLGVIGSSLTGN